MSSSKFPTSWLAAALAAGTAHAQLTLVDDFESYAPATAGTEAGWTAGFAGGAGAATTTEVNTSPLADGQGLVFTYGGEGGQINTRAGSAFAPEGATGTLFLQAGISATGSDTLFAAGRAGATGYGDLGVLFRVPSDLIVEVRDGDTYVDTTTSVELDTVYSFWAVIDNDANTWDLYYAEGQQAATLIQADIAFRDTTAGDLDAVYIGTNGGSAVTIDELHIDPSGENLSNPTFVDSDGDGLGDDWETANGLDPDDDGSGDPANGASGDPDGDGFENIEEFQAGTDPQNDDTDGDGLLDGAEADGSANQFDGAPTDPLVADSDGDGVSDGEENGALNTEFGNAPTDPNDPDTDGDDMPDGYELANNTPGTALDPNDDGSGDEEQAPDGDRDGDSLGNLDEFLGAGGRPQTRADLADTDDDGYDDAAEDLFGSWDDASLTGTDPTNPDTDGDGLLDGEENPDLGSFPGQGVTPTNSDPNEPDTDGDGFGDGYEVAQGTDPTDENDVPTQPSGFTLIEDFEGAGMTAGESFAGVNGWSSAVPETALVADEPIAGGDRVGSYFASAAGGAPLYRSLLDVGAQVFEGETGTLFLQLYTSTDTLDHSMGLSAAAAPAGFGDFEAQLVTAAGELRGRDADAFRVIGNHPVQEWMNVWIVADNDADTVRIFVESPLNQTDQVEITDDGSGDLFNFRNGTTSPLGTILFVENAPQDEPVYFDNLYVDSAAENLDTPAPAKPEPSADPRITSAGFGAGGDFLVTFEPGGAGFILTSSDDLAAPFTEEAAATYDGSDTFTVPAAALNPERDFFRVETE